MKDVMLDLETMGCRHDAMIVQIGMCYFDRDTGEIGHKMKINVRHANDDRFTVDWGTMNWWLSQSEAARKSITDKPDSLSPEKACELASIFLEDCECVWSHATFDMPIFQNMFETCGVRYPVSYKASRDISTLLNQANHTFSHSTRTDTHHDALDDCIFQVGYCVEAMNKLNKQL